MRKTSFNALSHLTALRAFEVAARLGSLKAAAVELYVTESAVSRLVRQLEQVTGTHLFERKHRRLELTEVGKELAQELTPAFERIRHAGDRVVDRMRAKPLVIAAPATFLLRWLIPRQSRLQQELPETPIRLATWDAPPNLDDNSISLFVGIGEKVAAPSATTIDLMQESFGLVVSPVLLRSGQHVSELLANIPRLMPQTRPKIWNDWVQEGGVDTSYDGVLEFERMYFTLQAAEAAVGSAIAPIEVVADALEAGRLVTPFGRIQRHGSYHLIVPNRISSNADVRKAIAWFKAECAATESKIKELSQPA
jgi:LysR family transcriptional regulator, glycine cleavage system transcriptional activator